MMRENWIWGWCSDASTILPAQESLVSAERGRALYIPLNKEAMNLHTWPIEDPARVNDVSPRVRNVVMTAKDWWLLYIVFG